MSKSVSLKKINFKIDFSRFFVILCYLDFVKDSDVNIESSSCDNVLIDLQYFYSYSLFILALIPVILGLCYSAFVCNTEFLLTSV